MNIFKEKNVLIHKNAHVKNKATNKKISGRKLFRALVLSTILLVTTPQVGFADQAKVDAAKDREATAQAKLDQIAQESEDLNIQLSQTYSEMNDVEDKIAKVVKEIDERKSQIAQRQLLLEKRVAADYKSGHSSMLSLLLNSSSFEEFTSNLFYFEKIASSDQKLINEINEQKNKLAQQEQNLINERKRLEQVQQKLKEQKAEVDKKQQEAAEYLESCSTQVQEAINERDREIAAAIEQRRRQELEQASGFNPPANVVISSSSGSLSAVLEAANVVPSPGMGLCAMWVSQVFSTAGFSYPNGNANDMYYSWCTSSDRSQLKPGMIVAVSTHPFSPAGKIYGHVGIYMGNGVVRDNIGYIRTESLDSWINFYSTVVPVRWGWVNGIALS